MLLILAHPSAAGAIGVKAANLEDPDRWQVHGLAADAGEADAMTRDRVGSFITVDLSTIEAKAYRSNLGKVAVTPAPAA